MIALEANQIPDDAQLSIFSTNSHLPRPSGGLGVGRNEGLANASDRFVPRMPSEATKQRPGTWGKFRVMIARVERGESCFHPDDLEVRKPINLLSAIRMCDSLDGRG